VILAAVVWNVLGKHLAGAQAAFRESAIENVTYYRFKASFIVKDTQEHIDFDYVAACATVATTYKDGDRSMDTLGLNPKSFIKATRAGHAIQVATPKACNSEVADGDIPPDLFPFAVFYEDVADMRFGWGYASQDAYDNPKARMSFEGATITAATSADWKVWRAKAEAEFKQDGDIKSPWGYSGEDHGAAGVAQTCGGFTRTPIIDSARGAVRHEWEKQGKPEFWVDQKGGLFGDWNIWRPKVEGEFVTAPIPRTRGGGMGLVGIYSRERYMMSRKEPYVSTVPNEIYPVLPFAMVAAPAQDLEQAVFPRKLLVSTEWQGFVACGSPKSPFDRLLAEHFKAVGDAVRQNKTYGKHPFVFMVNDLTVLPNDGNALPPVWVFQRDEYLLFGLQQSTFDYY
jgi:hypothetical protein